MTVIVDANILISTLINPAGKEAAIILVGLLWTGNLKLLRALKRKDFNQIITTPDFEQILKGL